MSELEEPSVLREATRPSKVPADINDYHDQLSAHARARVCVCVCVCVCVPEAVCVCL